MKANKEYQVCKAIATYLKYQYPKVIFRFDMAGLCLSKAQAGMNKAIQYGKGYPDLFIAEKRGQYGGLFIEVKANEVKIFNRDKSKFSTDHIAEQGTFHGKLWNKGYLARFACGFDEAKTLIDAYLKGEPD